MRSPNLKMVSARPLFIMPVVLGLATAACGSAENDTQSSSTVIITGAGGGGPGSSSSGSAEAGAGGSGGAAEGRLGAPYPIVLAHGFFGFEDFAGLGFETYFFNVKQELAQSGETLVFTPAVDPFNSSDYRGDQLIERIEDILAETGHEKVNIIGHSQGGLDARAVAHKRPDLVASVITVATPHHGSPVADVVLQLVDDPYYQDVLNDILKLIGAPLYDEIGNETDVFKPLYLFSEPGIAEFNMKHPDRDGIFYASVTGRSGGSLGGDDCKADVPQSFITSWASSADPIDPLLALSEFVVAGDDDSPNDGLVRARDARWGHFWGCIPADHLDQVGQLLGDGAGKDNPWTHIEFYSQLVKRVRAQGL
jgi:triacylglycerol lipase